MFIDTGWQGVDAVPWAKASINPTQAAVYRELGIQPGEATRLAKAGYDALSILRTWWDGGIPRTEVAAWLGAGAPDVLLRQSVDGVLYATMYHRVVRVPGVLSGIPTVLIDAQDAQSRAPWTVPDEASGARAAALSMISHRQCMSPRESVEPIYMPGRLRTASKPSSTERWRAV